MGDLNKVFLIGRLTRDPELRTTASGSAVTDLGLAVNRSYTTKDGEKRDEATFLDVTVWERQAENCAEYLRKGSSVHIEGRLKLDNWEDRTTGEKRSKLKVEADRVQFLDGKRDDQGGGREAPTRRAGSDERTPSHSPAPSPPRDNGNGHGSVPPRRSTMPPRPTEPIDENEDIPFFHSFMDDSEQLP